MSGNEIGGGDDFFRRSLTAFESVLNLLSDAVEIEKVLPSVCTLAAELADADVGAIATAGRDIEYRFDAVSGARGDEWRAFSAPLGSGLVGQAIEMCVTRHSANYPAEVAAGLFLGPAAREIIPGEGLTWGMATPMLVRGDALGALVVGGRNEQAPPLDLGAALETIARQLALSLDMARLLSAARDQAFHAELLNSIAKKLRGRLETDAVVTAAAAAIGDGLGAERCVVLLDNEETAGFEIAADHHPERLPALEDDAETLGAIGQLLATVGDRDWTGSIEEDLALHGRQVEMVAAPVTFGGEEIGAVVAISGEETARFKAAELRLVERLADEVGRAIGHARLFESESQAVARLRELDQMKNEFVSVVSHELRTPLTSIKGFTATLIENEAEYDEDERLRFLGIIARQAERLERLIGDFLDVSRIQQGALGLAYGRVKVLDVASECARALNADATSAGREIVVKGSGAVIEGDREKIAQVITNLISNSLKYGEGQITIEVADSETGLNTTVSDEGKGIPQDEASRIFDKFFQAEQGSTRRSKGVGLGLAIVKGLVQAHGGRVWYEPVEPHGARFCFFLPWVVPESIRERNVARSGRTDLLLG